MLIEDVSLRTFRLPLREPLETGAGRIDAREGVVLVLRDAAGRSGHGEAAPLPGHPAFSQEDLETAAVALEQAGRALRGRSVEDSWESSRALPGCGPAARFALETAVADLLCQGRGVRLADWLAGGRAPHQRVPVNALVGASDPDAVRAQAARLRTRGFTTFKLKVAGRDPAADAKRVAALRAAVGPEGRIRLDANAAWSPAEARQALGELGRFGLDYVEDPLAVRCVEDVAALAALRAQVRVPLAADDCLADPKVAREVLATRAVDWLVLKLAPLGGLDAARRLARAARERGVGCVVTSSLDAAIGLTASLHLAASLPGASPACGLATAEWLIDDVGCPPAIRDGWLRLPAAAGLGLLVRSGW